jgi:hypothetical protein
MELQRRRVQIERRRGLVALAIVVIGAKEFSAAAEIQARRDPVRD